MGQHVIVGAGAIGRALAAELAQRGEEVVIVSRRGVSMAVAGVSVRAVDATDTAALARVASGARSLYNCANPAYHRWVKDWPPMASSMLGAAAASGAALVTMSNLYGYGPVEHPMRPSEPLVATTINGRVRAQMWRDALAAHEAGRVRVTEARASDFVGPGTGATSHLGHALGALRRGRTVRVLGHADVVHSWSFTGDVAATLAELGTREDVYGRAWHVPSSEATQRELLAAAAARLSRDEARVAEIAPAFLTLLALASPQVRRLRDVAYQFERPFVIDATETTERLGLDATPLDAALDETVPALVAAAS
jgi:nucleoside-diphosphate-sugar epimerase